jgi:sugar phosphate isomerase/epimerase
MIRNLLGLRLDPERPVRDQIYEAARIGARGIVVDAVGDLAPHRLGETGRREFRHILRTVELSLIALSLPTRRPFDTIEQLDERLRRAEAAFAMAFELGTDVVLARVGAIPSQEDAARREVFTGAVRDLGLRAEYRGVRLAIETGTEPGESLRAFLTSLAVPSLAVSIDPSSLLQVGIDPVQSVRDLAEWVAHAYASDATGTTRVAAPNPRGFGYPSGALDWEEYLGALEEIGYRGFLTVWPSPGRSAAETFTAISERLERMA